jgi:hypothetical protein
MRMSFACPNCGAKLQGQESAFDHADTLLLSCSSCHADLQLRPNWSAYVVGTLVAIALAAAAVGYQLLSRVHIFGLFIGSLAVGRFLFAQQRFFRAELLRAPNPALQPTVPPSAGLPSQAPPARRG